MIDDKELLVQELADSQKLNKQKRTLRILNVLTALLLILAVVIVPISFSRYSSTVASESSASIANIKYNLSYDYTTYTGTADNKVYKQVVIFKEFSIKNTGEVSFKYSLKLKLGGAGQTFDTAIAPSNISLMAYNPVDDGKKLYTTNNTNNGFADITCPCAGGIAPNTAYICFSPDGNTNYGSWIDMDLTDGVLDLSAFYDNNMTILNIDSNTTHYYKIMIFYNISSVKQLESSYLYYDINCEQID